jgi:alkylation response protein AidB-like acyl-CoA dehydrogenase
MTHSLTTTGVAGARADREARLSPDTVAWLTMSGLPRHFVPRGDGGTGGTFADVFTAAVIEAETCASAAWCATLWAWHARCVAMLPERARREIWGASPDVLISAGLKPSGRAEPAASGWRVTGSWTRVSGAVYAQWILLAVGDGLPEPLILAAPADAVTVLPTWDAAGLRATRTDSVEARGIFVPEYRAVPLAVFLNGIRTGGGTSGAAGGEPLPRSVTTPAMLGGPVLLCASALGSARAAVRMWAESEGSGPSAAPGNDPEAQRWCSSRLEDISVLLERAAGRADQGPVDAAAVERNRRDVAVAADMLRAVTERAARGAGSAASSTRAVLERSRRDVYTATSHAALRPAVAAVATAAAVAAVAQRAVDGRVR